MAAKTRQRALLSASSPALFIPEDRVQAIVLADSFNMRFRPITLEVPRALLPLCNFPLIDYTIEFLVSSGIKDITIYCCAHGALISQHVERRWRHNGNEEVNLTCVTGTDSLSAGDALRDLYDRGDIRNDFLLVNGDVVANIKLKKIIEQHRARKKEDPRYIMSSLFKKVRPSHQTRAGEDDTILAIDPNTNQLLYYENRREKDSIRVERSLFLDHPTVQFRYDLMDCHIDICTPAVLGLYKEHFDFGHPRRDFLKAVLESTDLLHTVYFDVIEEEYAARVRDLYTYGAVSRDIVRRWAYPLVPDNNCIDPSSSYSYARGNIYLEENVDLASTCDIGQNSIIGTGTTVGPNALVTHSIIGPGCVIGPNVKINHAFIWEGVVLEEGVTVDRALLCSGVRIGSRSVIEAGCVLSNGVQVPPNTTVPQETKLTLIADGLQTSPFLDHTDILVWVPNQGSLDSDQSADDEDEDHHATDFSPAVLTTSTGSPNSLVYCPYTTQVDSQSDSTDSEDFNSDDEPDEDLNSVGRYHQELRAITMQALDSNWDVDSAMVQVKSLKFSFDKTWVDCAQVFVPAFLKHFIEHSGAGKAGAPLLAAFKEIVLRWKQAFSVFCLSSDDQAELIYLLQEFAESDQGKPFAAIFSNVLHLLYEEDLLEEEAIFEWESDQKSLSGENLTILKSCAAFLQWLRSAESESDSGSDDDDDDDD